MRRQIGRESVRFHSGSIGRGRRPQCKRLAAAAAEALESRRLMAVDLTVSISDGVDETFAGNQLGYSLTYANAGDSEATGVVLTQNLPAGTTYVGDPQIEGWTETGPSTGIYTLPIGSVAAGGFGFAFFSVRLAEPTPVGQTQVVSTATIDDDHASGADATPADNTAIDTDVIRTGSLIVTTAADEDDGSSEPALGTGTSLREAMAYAAVHDGDDTITFAAAAFPAGAGTTITLTGELSLDDVDGKVTITGPGQNSLIIKGSTATGGSRHFNFNKANVALSAMTLADGTADQGGSIRAFQAPVQLTDVTLSNNRAASTLGGGAIAANFSDLTLLRTTLSGNTALDGRGAGISTSVAGLTITDSTFVGNTFDDGGIGGGIWFNRMRLKIVGSTFSGNEAASGAAIWGSETFSPTATIINSTFANNTGSAALHAERAGIDFRNVTIVGNAAGGIDGGDSFGAALNNTIVSLNGGNDLTGTAAATTTSNNSLVGVANPGVVLDIAGKPLLAVNGGPTKTVALRADSVARNAGSEALAVDPIDSNAPLTTDQRGAGFPRKVDGAVDIGAYESAALSPQTLTLQAELATFDSKSKVNNKNRGFNGTGYVNMDGKRSFVEFAVNGVYGPETKLEFRYANGSSANRPADVFVDGVKIGTLSFGKTGAWTKWSTASLATVLSQGPHTVKLVVTRGNGPDLDQLAVIPVPATKPIKPTTFDSVAQSRTSVKLTWADKSYNETGFRIFRSTSSSFGSFITIEVPANTTSYLDTGLQANTKYYYRMEAFNAVGISGFSSVSGERTKK